MLKCRWLAIRSASQRNIKSISDDVCLGNRGIVPAKVQGVVEVHIAAHCW